MFDTTSLTPNYHYITPHTNLVAFLCNLSFGELGHLEVLGMAGRFIVISKAMQGNRKPNTTFMA